jgi:hypothetical protein
MKRLTCQRKLVVEGSTKRSNCKKNTGSFLWFRGWFLVCCVQKFRVCKLHTFYVNNFCKWMFWIVFVVFDHLYIDFHCIEFDKKDSGNSCRHRLGTWWKVQGITELVYGGIKILRIIKPKKNFILSRECGLLEILVGMGVSIYVYMSFKWRLLYELHGLSIEIVW